MCAPAEHTSVSVGGGVDGAGDDGVGRGRSIGSTSPVPGRRIVGSNGLSAAAAVSAAAGGGRPAESLGARAMTRAAWRRVRLVAHALANDIAARDWRAPPRPWPEFFARFALPRRSADAWTARVALNSHLYQSNYALGVGVALVVYVVRRPWAVFVVAAHTVVCVHATAPRPLVVCARRVTRHQRHAAAALFSLALLAVTGLIPSVFALMVQCALVILLHASLRHSHVRAHLGDIGIQKDNW